MKILFFNIVAIVCVGIAGYLAIQGKPASTWGWFLFVGAITTITNTSCNCKEEEEDDYE